MSNMNGGVMKSQRARVGAGYQPPALPFAQLPNPDSVLGRVYTASDVGPAPGIELIAAPGRWRPRGGRQLLAMRSNNPVTIQNTVATVADTLGPFPGGLVRAGMQLALEYKFGNAGIGTGPRTASSRIGTGALRGAWHSSSSGSSSATSKGVALCWLDVLSDTDAAHVGGFNGPSISDGQVNGRTPQVDFSQAWSADITLVSANETAVNITNATWSAGVATYTATGHTLITGDKDVVAGITPSGFNQTNIVTRIDNNTFTMPLAANPGAYTSGGTSSRISNMISQSYALWLVG